MVIQYTCIYNSFYKDCRRAGSKKIKHEISFYFSLNPNQACNQGEDWQEFVQIFAKVISPVSGVNKAESPETDNDRTCGLG